MFAIKCLHPLWDVLFIFHIEYFLTQRFSFNLKCKQNVFYAQPQSFLIDQTAIFLRECWAIYNLKTLVRTVNFCKTCWIYLHFKINRGKRFSFSKPIFLQHEFWVFEISSEFKKLLNKINYIAELFDFELKIYRQRQFLEIIGSK